MIKKRNQSGDGQGSRGHCREGDRRQDHHDGKGDQVFTGTLRRIFRRTLRRGFGIGRHGLPHLSEKINDGEDEHQITSMKCQYRLATYSLGAVTGVVLVFGPV